MRGSYSGKVATSHPTNRQEMMMEKTIKYLLQEAYVDGYKDGYDAATKETEKTDK